MRIPDEQATAPPAAAPTFAARRRRRARILLACGSARAMDGHAAALRRAGFEVQTAADGLETLARAVARRPDAVIVDTGVPGMDGWEITRRLKAAAATRDIPVIAVAPGDPGGARARASAAGCAACLGRGCPPEDLAGEVTRQLDFHRLRPRRRGRAGRA